MHTSDTHAAQSNIQDGISSDRAISEPSNVQRKTLLPPRPRREQKRRARTRDEADKEALGAPSCGRSQTSLYNEVRPHGPIGNEPPVPSQENSTFRRSAFDSRSESALPAETLIAVR
jgi:hypothetical protein